MLPPPLTGGAGWPWIAAASPPLNLGSEPWPRITVVTPSYQQGAFVERTIRSVLAQGYPNLDYRVYDGGSTDESVRIIRHYERYLSHWESIPDRGQSHAINKGLSSAEGEIVGWLNSDDILLPEALLTIARHLRSPAAPAAVVGSAIVALADGSRIPARGRYVDHERLLAWWRPYEMPQPAIYWRRALLDEVGPLDESEHQAMDYDLWLRISQRIGFQTIPEFLAEMTAHPDSKTADGFDAYRAAQDRIARAYRGGPRRARFWRLAASAASHRWVRPPARAVRSHFRR